MRIGIITSSYPRTPEDSRSAGVFVRDFALALRAEGVDVLVLTPQKVSGSDDEVTVVSFPWPGDETSLTHLNPRKPINAVRLAVLLASGARTTLRVLRSWRPSYTVAMWAVPSGLLAWAADRRLRVPYAVWALGSDIWRIRDYPLGKTLLRMVLRRARLRYADGRELAGDVEAISGKDCQFLASSRVLPLPESDRIPDLDPSCVHFLCVARFHPHKGVDVLIEAVARLPQAIRAKTQVHVFGDGPQRPDLERRVRELHIEEFVRIGTYIGPEDLAAYLRAARCLVIPSRIESIPLILSDAAQAGSPVIASDVGDMGELVREYGVGLTVQPGAADGLAAAMIRFHTGEAEFDPEGAKRLADRLSVQTSAQRFLEQIGASVTRGGTRPI